MRISKRDWAQLSAYLDGELNQREKQKLQKRIESNPDFQAALEDLRTVKSVLSHTPRLNIPKDFTLKGSLVERPRHLAPVRGYSLAAAALSFLFISVVVLDIGSSALKGGLSGQAPRAEEVMLEAVVDEMEEPVMLAKEAVGEEEMAPAAEMESDAEAPESFDGSDLTGMVEGEANLTPEEAERAAAGGEDTPAEKAQDEIITPSPTEELEYEETPVTPVLYNEQIDEPRKIPWMMILEISFGLGAVVFAGVALWNRRKNRK